MTVLIDASDRPGSRASCDAPPPEPAACVVLYTSADCWRGAGISFVNIARGLSRHGFRPHVIAMCPEVVREFRDAGIPVVEVVRGERETRCLRRLLSTLGARVLLVDRAHDLRVATLAVLGTPIALISRYNHFRPKPPTDLVVRVAHQLALREVVFLSNSARTRVLDEWPFMRRPASTTIYEGVDPEQFRPCSRAAAAFRARFALGDEPFVLAVGALAVEKRYPVLLEALARLGRDAPLLVICGEGPERATLTRMADALSLRVRLLGRIPQPALAGAYNAALGLVHVGAVETFGLAVLEAMTCGRPVVAAAGGALPEVLGAPRPCGTLVPPDSPGAVADAMRWLIDRPGEAAQQGLAARERARTHFTVGAMEEAYARLVARHLAATRRRA